MKNFLLRLIIFLSAAGVTLGVPLLIAGELSRQAWTGIGFLILAEALNILVPGNFRKKSFPLHLGLMLFVFPVYFAATLVLALCSRFLSWNWFLAIEILLVFPVIAASCIAGMCSGRSEEETR